MSGRNSDGGGELALAVTDLEAQAVCDRVAILDHFRILTVDTPAGLIEKHRDDPRVVGVAHGQVTLDDVFTG
jgi:ABC-2 type transport system ATP-binding protein